eukprot:Awhi_evm1s13707
MAQIKQIKALKAYSHRDKEIKNTVEEISNYESYKCVDNHDDGKISFKEKIHPTPSRYIDVGNDIARNELNEPSMVSRKG